MLELDPGQGKLSFTMATKKKKKAVWTVVEHISARPNEWLFFFFVAHQVKERNPASEALFSFLLIVCRQLFEKRKEIEELKAGFVTALMFQEMPYDSSFF